MTAPTPPSRFALFADCLLIGCLTALAALPVITAYPALVAACASIREHVTHDRSAGLRRYATLLAQVVRSGPSVLLVPPLVVAVLALDAVAIAAGAPGSAALAVLLVAAASVAAVLGLRIAARWQPGARWNRLVRGALPVAARDIGGSALLWLAAGTAVAVVLAVPVTALLVAGPLALAAVAVDLRGLGRVAAD